MGTAAALAFVECIDESIVVSCLSEGSSEALVYLGVDVDTLVEVLERCADSSGNDWFGTA